MRSASHTNPMQDRYVRLLTLIFDGQAVTRTEATDGGE